MDTMDKTEEPAFADGLNGWSDGPAFRVPANTRLKLPESADDDRVAEHLAHRVTRFPKDLRAHAQRLLLHVRRQDRDRTYGALLDIFLVLGAAGEAFRSRMLDLSAGVLGPKLVGIFTQHLDTGLDASAPMPISPHSRLARGDTGGSEVVTREETESDDGCDALVEARDLIDLGQLAEAQQALEKAVLDNPEREELTLDLLELYRYTRDDMSFLAMQKRLENKSPEAAERWAALAAFFSVG